MSLDYLSILSKTDQCAATELLYAEYINGHPAYKTPQETAVATVSAAIDRELKEQSVSDETIADYEEAARRAGFYAGFRAAVAYTHFLQQLQGDDERGVSYGE